MEDIKMKNYGSNAELFIKGYCIDISFEGWGDYDREENAEGIIYEVESQTDLTLTNEEKNKILDLFEVELNLRSADEE